ncbi:hypothetical protein RHGRI_006776 [Rhododendron griersonianum]|uniref:Uncharacterized protein n=1 Tax=Rhododendron griersonianum TaxID=479676 RepID=A0AAV6KV35_9ERIC|nr:hypothetical protein RHGRI_006776 [Rhododendron griersonianum]
MQLGEEILASPLQFRRKKGTDVEVMIGARVGTRRGSGQGRVVGLGCGSDGAEELPEMIDNFFLKKGRRVIPRMLNLTLLEFLECSICYLTSTTFSTSKKWLFAAGVIFGRLQFRFNKLKELSWFDAMMNQTERDSLASFLHISPHLEKLFIMVRE